MIDMAVTDLPLPDSPTRPRVSPGRISKLTSSTAAIDPPGRSNTVVRWSTASRLFTISDPCDPSGLRDSRGRGVFVLAEDGSHRVGNFADRRVCLDSVYYCGHEVPAARRRI